MKQEGGVPVLAYHSVTRQGSWLPWSHEYSVSPVTFERHIEILLKSGCHVIRTLDLVHARRSRIPLPARSVVIHLDDGYLDNWVAAFPILKRYGVPATLFVSLDFIEPGDTPRPTVEDVEAGRCREEDVQWGGYLNWAELRLLQASGLVDIEAHGTDHGRVETGPRIIGTVSPENWRREAWLQWRAIPGNKSGWIRYEHPPCVPYGSPIKENSPALAARSWSLGTLESEEEYASRVRMVLRQSREVLGKELDKEVRIFCWPYGSTTKKAREFAESLGYWATSGGEGENRPGEDPTIISRIYAGDRSLGWRWLWAEGWFLLARVRLSGGNYYWYLVVFPLNLYRKVLKKIYHEGTQVFTR